MHDGPDNPTVARLRRLDGTMDKLAYDMLDVKQRLGQLVGQYASIARRVDSLDIRLERVERRLDICAVE
jgi:tetrahydromethanopterin S-methyltransferase subunit G